MFLRSHGRSKDGKDHTYWSLVETVRTPNGPRQKTLCYLGELNSSAQVRIPLKWGTDSGEVGQRRSGATLVTAMISEVPHMSQEFCCWRGKQHHFVSIISFLRAANSVRSGARFRWEAGQDSGTCGA